MLTSRTRAAAAVLEGQLYVMGGSDGDRALSSGKAIQCQTFVLLECVL